MRSIKEMVNILVCSVSFKLRLSLVDLSSKRSRHTTSSHGNHNRGFRHQGHTYGGVVD